eukprot:7234529-Prymnesium_polylepis.1
MSPYVASRVTPDEYAERKEYVTDQPHALDPDLTLCARVACTCARRPSRSPSTPPKCRASRRAARPAALRR